ncbi:ATPase associated with various cellular activities, AAA_5 [Staphylothermus marinus F1]|uniref:ATPase associated with various cellular activities, AAA_5 n=1 Tax=Staphylothermus marinus (strain ATCC 43588 / DSM 3639 / JCM 9404 / F1) TaxID=399550 RepID=A3DPE6_STAMF|nr:AAA family ATPase [Staphylothermus marinus]ABN70506.1 ATPase associated with various cellular activities, AAA_5 [Staphylothermus marinus F1]
MEQGFTQLLHKAHKFVEELARPFVGREEEAKVIALAIISGEHVVLIGEPGTAKSALARRAAELINAKFFKYLLTKFTEPDELFGPLDINALKQGKYVRITRNKLPEAEIAFIDEIFNANSAILNMFLTIMNERIVYDGYNEIKVPLWTMIAASNNVPDEPELQALYDRFLYRHFVKPISEDKWAELLEASWKIESGLYEHAEPILSMNDVRMLNKILYEVNLEPIKEKLLKLYAIFEDQGIHITDRRKGKALKAIAASALLDRRMSAREEDLFVLKHIAPHDMEEMEQANAILLDEIKATEKHLRELAEIEANAREAKNYIMKVTDFDPRLVDYLRSFEAVRERVRRIAEETSDEVVRQRGLDVLSEVNEVIDMVKRKFMI